MASFSLARAHRARMLAAQAATSAARSDEATGPAATEYELKRAELGQDLTRLREIQSVEAKIELKRELLPKYQAWVTGLLEAAAETGQGGQDDVLVQVMIWSFDVGNFAGALELADYVLRYHLELPQRFTRTAGCFIAEAVADAALRAANLGESFDLDVLLEADRLTEAEDMPDQVRAKLNKAIGIAILADAKASDEFQGGPAGMKRAAFENAAYRFRRALELDERSGVKKLIEQTERDAAKAAEQSGGQGEGND